MELTLAPVNRKAAQLSGVFNFGEQSYELILPLPSIYRRLVALFVYRRLTTLFAHRGTYMVNFGIRAGELSLELTNLISPVRDRGMLVRLPVDRTIESTVTSTVTREQTTETTDTLTLTAQLPAGSAAVAASDKQLTKGGNTIQHSEKRNLCEVTIHGTGPPASPLWRFQAYTTDNNKGILLGIHVEPRVAKLVVQQPGAPCCVVGTFHSRPDDLQITKVSGNSSMSDRKRAAVQARVLKHLRAKMPRVLAQASTNNVTR